MIDALRALLSRSSTGEIVGAAIIVVSAVVLIVAAFAYGAGDQLSFFALLLAFAAGVTGLGVHIAGREARIRREGR